MKVLLINGVKVEYKEVKAPSIVINEELFSDCVNSILIARYTDEYTVKRYAAEKRANNAEQAMNEYGSEKEYEEEFTSYAKAYDKSKADLEKYISVLAALRDKRKELGDIECPDDLKEIVSLFSALYSTCGGVDVEKNKIIPLTAKGMRNLYNACTNYADQYENADDWTDSQKMAFESIRSELVTFGSRLNGEATDNRKGFSYSAKTKDVKRLIAYVTKYAAYNRTKGNFKTDRNNIRKFQATAIATVFRISGSELSSNEIEF